jgi:hypothetical protein
VYKLITIIHTAGVPLPPPAEKAAIPGLDALAFSIQSVDLYKKLPLCRGCKRIRGLAQYITVTFRKPMG